MGGISRYMWRYLVWKLQNKNVVEWCRNHSDHENCVTTEPVGALPFDGL